MKTGGFDAKCSELSECYGHPHSIVYKIVFPKRIINDLVGDERSWH